MLPIVSIATASYRALAERLVRSARRAMPEVDIAMYTDEPGAFLGEPFDSIEIRPLPEIADKGVKKARFDLYLHALGHGDFVYLDADIIVLEPFPTFPDVRVVGACPDDLSAAHDYIADIRHPWPDDPTLENRRYVNSGVIVIREAARSLLERAWERANDDAYWRSHVIPGKLHDNHLLCAVLNEIDCELTPLDPNEWNWPGFVDAAGQLQVRRQGNHLVNVANGRPLRLVHLAGHRDVQSRLAELPLDVASLLESVSTQASPEGSLPWPRVAGVLDDLVATAPSERRDAANVLFAGLREVLQPPFDGHGLVRSPAGLTSVALSVPSASTTWNGLRTGGAYLEGDEYSFLDDVIRIYGLRRVIETGAGETSRLFASRGVRILSLETQAGPWVERAEEGGALVRLLHFDAAAKRFDPAELTSALGSWRRCDLLLVDSPVGTAQRRGALDHLLEVVEPRLIAFHDAHRDSELVLDTACRRGHRVLEYLGTRRGLVLIGPRSRRRAVPSPPPPSGPADAAVGVSVVRQDGEGLTIEVEVVNESKCRLSSMDPNPFRISYHWYDASDQLLVWDGVRTDLPFALRPGDRATFPVTVTLPPDFDGEALTLKVCAVIDGLAWLDETWPQAGVDLPLEAVS